LNRPIIDFEKQMKSGTTEKNKKLAPAADANEDPRQDAARTRLRESRNRADVIEGMREVVTNLLGCEEIGLYTVEQGKSSLLWSFGIDSQKHATLDAFNGPALNRLLRGEFQIVQITRQGPDQGSPFVQVLVPICRSERTVAVLVMFKLLPQKTGFEEADLKLLRVLSEETGKALFGRAASAHA
jgi:hypothetical protein